MSAYDLLLLFDSDEPEFVRGFEAGRVWSILGADEDRHDFTVRVENAEMMIRMAERTDRVARAEGLDERWVQVFFSEVGGAV